MWWRLIVDFCLPPSALFDREGGLVASGVFCFFYSSQTVVAIAVGMVCFFFCCRASCPLGALTALIVSFSFGAESVQTFPLLSVLSAVCFVSRMLLQDVLMLLRSDLSFSRSRDDTLPQKKKLQFCVGWGLGNCDLHRLLMWKLSHSITSLIEPHVLVRPNRKFDSVSPRFS